MLSLLKKLLALFGFKATPTVASATEALQKAAKGLEDVVEHHTNLAALKYDVITAAHAVRDEALKEADKAKAVLTNVKALFGE